MALRLGIALAICLGMAATASAQVVRFETTAGNFDMVLNPTNNALLQGHVDNMVHYVENGNYNGSWINRAGETETGENFVLQMGGFFSHTKRTPMTIDSTRPVAAFAPVTGQPMISGLSNTVGTVSLALPGSNPNGGTSSFFVNLASNNFLDQSFTVFAAISDMTVVNQIMALSTRDLTDPAKVPLFGADPTNLTFTEVPIMADGFQVFIKRAFVVGDPLTIARATAGVQATMALSASSAGAGGASSLSPLLSATVPEPASFIMAAVGLGYVLLFRRSRGQ
ncbi:MAG: peptidylprolyl isomerase [Pirellulales bacterium]